MTMYHTPWTLVMTFVSSLAISEHPIGHMKPLGSEKQCLQNVTLTTKFPAPWAFYHNFVKESQPLIMKGVLEKKGIPGYRKWSDEYLSKNHGEMIVQAVKGKKEDRVNTVSLQKTFREFIQTYHNEGLYMSTDVPPSMAEDVTVPVTLQCGGFQNSMAKVLVSLSSGGTKSTLHNDNLDNIMCVLDGSKQYLMADRIQKDLVLADGWFYNHGLYSNVDVERVDMYKFPKFQEISWYNITLNKGDCLYLPFGWYYQVNTENGRRNFGLIFRFTHLMWYNETDCENVNVHQTSYLSFKKFKMLTGENEGQEIIRFLIFEQLQQGRFNTITRENFYTIFVDITNAIKKELDECFDFIDENKDGLLTWKEIQLFDLNALYDKHEALFDIVISHAESFEKYTEDDGEQTSYKGNDKASEDMKEANIRDETKFIKAEINKKDSIHREL